MYELTHEELRLLEHIVSFMHPMRPDSYSYEGKFTLNVVEKVTMGNLRFKLEMLVRQSSMPRIAPPSELIEERDPVLFRRIVRSSPELSPTEHGIPSEN